MAYRLSKKAADDIRNIYRQSERLLGAFQAERYHRYLEEIFVLLDQNPDLARERAEIDPPVKVHPCGAHLVIYRKEQTGSILVIRVRHHRENWS